MTDVNKVIEEILKANPAAMLTGSRALIAQGFKVRNEPNDVDIWLPDGVHFQLIPGMIYPKSKEQVEAELAEAQPVQVIASETAPVLNLNDVYADVRNMVADAILYDETARSSIRHLINKFDARGITNIPSEKIIEFKAALETLLKSKSSKASCASVTDFTACASKPKDNAPSGEPIDYKITIYKYEGLKIEVHSGRPGEVRKPVECMPGSVCHYLSIINEKIAFVRTDSPTLDRHRNDVIYFLTANF